MAASKPIKNVIIVGAGIGGLAAAHALRRLGLSVKVLERAAFFSPAAGAGFGFSPNGQACLATLGLKDKIDKVLHPLRFHEMRGHGGRLIVNADHLDTLLEKYGIGLSGTLRAQLADVLAEPLQADGSLLYSTNVCRVQQEGDRVLVEAQVEGGKEKREMEADLVVGADGINSMVARSVLGVKDDPVYSGEAIYYGVIEAPDRDQPWPFKNASLGQPNTLLQIFDRGEFIAFPVGGPLSHSKPYTNIVWAITHRTPEPPKREEWSAGGTRAELLKLLDSTYPRDFPAYECLEATDDDRLMHFGMSYRKPVTKWSKGRVTLLGDACHATLPYVGQGANQAIEDAVVLAACLEQEKLVNVDKALQRYQGMRFERTKMVVDTAWWLGKLMHVESSWASFLRDSFLHGLVSTGAFMKIAEEEIVKKCPVPIEPVSKGAQAWSLQVEQGVHRFL